MAEKENTQGPGTFIILNHRRNVKTNWGKHQYLPYHHSEHTIGVYPQSANIKPFFKKQLTDITDYRQLHCQLCYHVPISYANTSAVKLKFKRCTC